MTKMPKINAPLSTTGPKKIDGLGLDSANNRWQTKFSVESELGERLSWLSEECCDFWLLFCELLQMLQVEGE